MADKPITESARTELGVLPAIYLAAPTKVSFTGTATQTAAIDAAVVRLACSADCYYLQADDPTVTISNGHFLPAGSIDYIAHRAGQKFSVIRASGDGVLTISPAGVL